MHTLPKNLLLTVSSLTLLLISQSAYSKPINYNAPKTSLVTLEMVLGLDQSFVSGEVSQKNTPYMKWSSWCEKKLVPGIIKGCPYNNCCPPNEWRGSFCDWLDNLGLDEQNCDSVDPTEPTYVPPEPTDTVKRP